MKMLPETRLQHQVEEAEDVVAHHIGLILNAVAAWELRCAQCSDEEQQDLRLILRLVSGKPVQMEYTYVWNPGFQWGEMISGGPCSEEVHK